MGEEIVPLELTRMFLGDAPALFYVEILFRTVVIYTYSLVLIRWVGGRGIAQMSTVEFLLVIALGSAVGDAMFYPEVPMLYAMLVISVVVVINKVLDVAIFASSRTEKFVNGRTFAAIKDGVLVRETLRQNLIGSSEVFESMREHGFTNLGQVAAGYLETSGRFSFFRAERPRPGLQIEPAWDIVPLTFFGPNHAIENDLPAACCKCGQLTDGSDRTPERCDNCGGASWTRAINAGEVKD